jgi:hypothetical protein
MSELGRRLAFAPDWDSDRSGAADAYMKGGERAFAAETRSVRFVG